MKLSNWPQDLKLEQYPIWTKAALTTSQVDPFCCTTSWQLAFQEAFSPNCRLLIKESGNNAVVFAEKVFSPEEIYLTPIEAHWFFGCPLLGKHSVDLLDEMLAEIEQIYRPHFPKILISGIRPKGVLARRLIQTFADRFTLYFHSAGVQCAASLKGGVDGYLSRRSGNHRKKLKKYSRRAAEQGVYFERVSPASAEEAATTYARMIAVELTSWKGIGKCGMAEPPGEQFYDHMLKRLSVSQDGRVIFAKHEGKDIGFIFGGKAGNIYRGQQFSYTDTWKKHSIGNIMQIEQIKWLCEEGAKRYDMGPIVGPRMGYKAHWTEKHLHAQTWVLEKK